MNVSMQNNSHSSPIHRLSGREVIDGFPTETLATAQTKQLLSA
jgi:hypothetical protein